MRVKYFSISLARVFEEVNCQLKVVHSLDEFAAQAQLHVPRNYQMSRGNWCRIAS